MKINFNSLFESAAFEMLAAFKKGEAGMRPDEKGAPREDVVRTFLRDWLPSKYEIAKGYIVNHNKDVSKECDAIIFDSTKCPKFFLSKQENIRIVPINYSYCGIEVKSILNDREIENSLEKAASLGKVHSNYVVKTNRKEEWIGKHLFLAQNVDLEQNSSSGRRKKTRDFDFYGYRALILDEVNAPSIPIRVLFAYGLSKNITLEDLKTKLLSHEYGPDLVIILNKGILVTLNSLTVNRLMSLKNSKPVQKYENSLPALLLDLKKDTLSRDYWIQESDAEHENLSYFYALLMDLLNAQQLTDYSVPADIVAIWNES